MTGRPILKLTAVLAIALGLMLTACGSDGDTAPGALPFVDDPSEGLALRGGGIPELTLVAPQDGAMVTSPVMIEAKVRNFQLSPPGVSEDGHGHLHVIVDHPCVEAGAVIDHHTHGESGAGEITLELEPGWHDVCVQLGDGFHSALAVTQQVRIQVVE